MDKTYSVSMVATMLGVNHEESVRRWIREDRLKAKRGLGRGGSTILLEDVVEFANRPPRAYLKSLISWLDGEGIKYEKIDDSTLQQHLIATQTAALMLSNPLLAPVGLVAEKALKKCHVPFSIKLVTQADAVTDEDARDDKNEALAEWLPDLEQTPRLLSGTSLAAESQAEDVQQVSFNEETDIKNKIRDEQIKLIKLKQELAQIQAQISVAEGQIAYYNLLLESDH